MQIRNLSITTPKGKPIINNLSLSVKKGEILAIMGPSGSGKTSLLDFISNHIRSNVNYESQLETQESIKYVSQEDHLHGFHTVRQYLDHYISLNYDSVSNEYREKLLPKLQKALLSPPPSTQESGMCF